MRLSKRQLKRIIREEYSRLKRRGLIREARMPLTQVSITFELMDGGEWSCDVPEHISNQLDDLLSAQSGDYGELSPDQVEQNEMELMETMDELYAICEEMAWDMGATEEGIGAPLSCTHDEVWNLIQKAGAMY